MQVCDTSSRLPFPGRVGLGGLPWSVAARAVTYDCSPSSSSFRASPARACSLLSFPVGRAAEALPPHQGTDGFSEVCASRGLPASAWKSVTPTSSEILVLLLGTQWALCLSPARRRFSLLYFAGFPCYHEDRNS